ncbi:gastrula zinc finger protein XlCGF58.1-like [Clytia hemisphaerica]|uniref:C2H2-type domain-containing protein n=1 Tax=Clytia hemisphaerica TaxID=252671 RepID=A0A7M5XHY2_9CNID
MWIPEEELTNQYAELIKAYFSKVPSEETIQSSPQETTEIEELEKKTKSLKIQRKESVVVESEVKEIVTNDKGKQTDANILPTENVSPTMSNSPITTAPMGKKRKRKQIDPDKVLWRSKRLKENDEKLAASSFNCTVCQKSFRREDIYLAHMLDHDQIGEQSILVKKRKYTRREKNLSDDLFTVSEENNIQKYQCRLCAHVFLQLDEALAHQKQHAKSSNQMYCGMCDKHFVRKDAFANHVESHKGVTSFECDRCGKCFASLDAISKHKLNSCKQSLLTFHKCTICEQDFDSQTALDAHEPCNIEGQVEFCCEPCGESFSVKAVFEEHLRSHEMQIIDPHTCATCGLKLTSKTEYEEHVKTHDYDIYRCHCCHEVYNLLEDLEMHYQMSETCIEVTCTDCKVNFQSSNELRTHLKEQTLAAATLAGEEIDIEETEVFICRFCQRGFHTNDPYVAHLKIHSSDKLKACDTCNETFETEEKLGIHYRLVHHRNTKFPCIECGLIFSEKAQLKKHCKESHANDNIFKCLPCGRTFYQKIEFNRHIVTKQHNKRVVEAGLADSTQSQLEGIRCPICERVCANNRELKRHQYDHQRIQSKPQPEKLLNRDQQVVVPTSESVPIILNDFYNFVDGEHVVLTTDDAQQAGAPDLLNARLDIDSEGNIGIIYVDKEEGEASVETVPTADADVEHMLVIKDDQEQAEISTASGHVNEEAFLALTEMVKQGKIDLSSFQVIQENPKEP